MPDELAGFDPADSSTWHPMNGVVVGALQGVASMLGIPLGINLAPAAEHIARRLYPLAPCPHAGEAVSS